jgi:hypothetical protein
MSARNRTGEAAVALCFIASTPRCAVLLISRIGGRVAVCVNRGLEVPGRKVIWVVVLPVALHRSHWFAQPRVGGLDRECEERLFDHTETRVLRDSVELVQKLREGYNRMLWTALKRKAAYLPG